MTITYHRDLIQGSDEWRAARCGMLTASEMRLVVTPTLKPAANDKMRAHLFELLAQRITGHVEPHYISDDMLRGQEDEAFARSIYAERYAPVAEAGFIVREFGGFRLGYSPDGLVADDGLIEIKSRRQKFQVQTIVDDEMPDEYMLQVQTGMLVSGRAWCDFVSYSGGLPMAVMRIPADPATQEKILAAAEEFEDRLADCLAIYRDNLARNRFPMTERRVEQELIL